MFPTISSLGRIRAMRVAGAVFATSALLACGGDPITDDSSSSQSSVGVSSSSSTPVSSAPVSSSSSSSGNSTAGSLLSDGTFTNGQGNFTAAGNVTFNGMVDFSISQVSTNPWDQELLHPVSVSPGQYTICFDAKSDEGSRTILVGIDEGPTAYGSLVGGDQLVSIGSSFQSFNYTWTINTTDTTARVQFKLGQSDVDVQLDNIGLYEGTECGGSGNNNSSSSVSSQAPSGNAARGETLFFGSANCSGCHAELNDGSGAFSLLDLDNLRANGIATLGLVDYIFERMPPVNAQTVCDEQCALDVAAFLREYKAENSGGNGSSGVDHIEGQNLFNAQCQTCHAPAGVERTTGVFSEESLRTKGIFRQALLADYIEDFMPPGPQASSCDADCAAKIASYIITWHVLPIDTSLANDEIPGRIDNPVTSQSCGNPSARSFGDRVLRILTNAEYANTVRDLFGYTEDLSYLLPVDGLLGSFKNNKDVFVRSNVEYQNLMQAGEQIADWAANTNFSFMNCGNLDQNCASRFMSDYAPRIFRRALTNAESSAYTAVANGSQTSGDVREGLKIALAAMLSSPQFLYRHEIGDANSALGNGAYELSSYEIATFLSYTFTQSTPTGDLWTAAVNDSLRNNPSRIRSEAQKLLSTDAAGRILEGLVHDWLGTSSVVNSPKDTAIFGNNYRDVTEDMVTELGLVFKDVMLNANGTFGDLYLPGETYVNSTLANHYGLGGGSNGFSKVSTPDRGGILLSGAFLTYYATIDEANPIRRATYIRRNMLCQYMPPPPPGVNVDRDDKAGELGAFLNHEATTNRMSYHRLTEGPTCLECHAEILNPLGFGLEDYDGMGRFRTTDNAGNVINAKGRLFSPETTLQFFGDPERDTTYHNFEGGQELAYMLAEGEASDQAKSCLAMQMYNYATGILVDSIINADSESNQNLSSTERDGYNCDVNDMVNNLNTGSPRSMLENLGALESIRYRKAQAR